MPVFIITEELVFPDVRLSEYDGLLGVGGDLSCERLQLAYSNGIFPWYSEGQPILWWSPRKRDVIYLDEFRVSKTLRKILKRNNFTLTMDQCFDDVINNCADIPRRNESGTWINEDMISAYNELHKKGFAHSFELWDDDKLIGGFYGVMINKVFSGESMFSFVSNASDIAFIKSVDILKSLGVGMIDCQITGKHLNRFGLRKISRNEYISYLTSI